MKFNIKRIKHTIIVGVASLALIIPLSMGSGASVHAARSYAHDPGLDELIYSGYCNDKGQWIGPKHDKWLYDHGLIDCDSDYNGVYEELQDYAAVHHISFMHAYRIFAAAEKMPAKYQNPNSDTGTMDNYVKLMRYRKRTHHTKRHVRKPRARKPAKRRNRKNKRHVSRRKPIKKNNGKRHNRKNRRKLITYRF